MTHWFKSTVAAIVVGAVLVTGASADGLSARVSSARVAVGDSFQLTLTVDGQGDQAPDLSPLQQDFDVLGSSQSSRTQIVNGRMSQSRSWIITLSPHNMGEAVIPSLSAGTLTSDPVTVTVVDPGQLPKSQGADGISITAEIGDGSHYVFQEIPLTVRIETGLPLQQASLAAPAGDFELTQTGQDRTSQIVRNGQQINVIERSYLLRPQHEGALTVLPFTLRGAIQDQNAPQDRFADFGFGSSMMQDMMRQSGFGNMMGGSAFGSMLNPAKQFLARSDVLEMTILPNPGTSVSDWFLPAKAVEFRSEWHPADPQFHEGEAVTRRISLLALGARPEQLPDLSFNDPDGARIYLDDTRTDMVETEDGTVARREFYVSVVPTRGGQITLPEISVEWLNTQTDEMQTATLAEVSIEAKGTIPAAVASPLVDQPVSPPIQRESTPLIMLVTAGLGALGITGAVLFWRRRSTNPAQPAIPDHLSSLRAFERAGDHAGFYSALLSLRSAPGKTNVAAINNAISQLENYAYSENSTLAKPDLGQILRDLVRSTDKTRSVFRGLGRRSGLPSLYPS